MRAISSSYGRSGRRAKGGACETHTARNENERAPADTAAGRTAEAVVRRAGARERARPGALRPDRALGGRNEGVEGGEGSPDRPQTSPLLRQPGRNTTERVKAARGCGQGMAGTVGEESTRNIVGVRYVVLPERVTNHREFARHMWEARRWDEHTPSSAWEAQASSKRPVTGRCRAFLDALKGETGPVTESGLEGQARRSHGKRRTRSRAAGANWTLPDRLRPEEGERQLCVEADGRRWHTDEKGERLGPGTSGAMLSASHRMEDVAFSGTERSKRTPRGAY